MALTDKQAKMINGMCKYAKEYQLGTLLQKLQNGDAVTPLELTDIEKIQTMCQTIKNKKMGEVLYNLTNGLPVEEYSNNDVYDFNHMCLGSKHTSMGDVLKELTGGSPTPETPDKLYYGYLSTRETNVDENTIKSLQNKSNNPIKGKTISNFNVPSGSIQIIIAYPANIGTIDSIFYYGVNDEYKDIFDLEVVSLDVEGTYTDYNVYISKDGTSGVGIGIPISGDMNFKITL